MRLWNQDYLDFAIEHSRYMGGNFFKNRFPSSHQKLRMSTVVVVQRRQRQFKIGGGVIEKEIALARNRQSGEKSWEWRWKTTAVQKGCSIGGRNVAILLL
jgi:hypothetical protein